MRAPWRLPLVVWGGVALFVAAVVLVAFSLQRTGQRAAIEENEGRAVRFVASTQAALNRTLLGIDVLLAGLSGPLQAAVRDDLSLDPATTQVLLRHVIHQNLAVRDVAVLYSDGRPVAYADANATRLGLDLPEGFLQAATASPAPSLVISDPVVHFGTAERVLYLGRVVPLVNGPRVLAVAQVPLPLLTTLLAQAADVPGLSVTLERVSGELLASYPPDELRLGTSIVPPASQLALTGEPMREHVRLGDAPAIVVGRPTLYPSVAVLASIPLSDALARWEIDRNRIIAVACGFIVLIVGAGAGIHAHLARLARARREIAEGKALLDQALLSMSDGFLLTDAQGRVVLWNERYLDIFPWLRPVLAPGVSLDELARCGAVNALPHGSDEERAAWVQRRLEHHSRGDGAHEQYLTDGRVIHVVERTMPAGGVVSMYHDVTVKERELQGAKAAAEAANESKSRFLASMSHEMRTPLNAVLGMNRLMLASGLDGKLRHYAQLIESSGQMLLALINDILDLSKIEAGRMELESIEVDVRGVVQDVVSLLRERAQARGLGLEVRVRSAWPPLLQGDAGRLRQVLLNLIGNAIKFTEQGEVVVEVDAQVQAGGQVALDIAVIDTGIGIDAAQLATLFQRFTQADSSTSRRYGGSGLGLAISREIIELMGGRITVHSEPGHGSTFRVELKLPLHEPQGAHPREPAEDTPAGDTPALRILVAEDNEVNQILIRAILDQLGHTCDLVANGELAVQQVQARNYDVVLMDVQMPVLDGVGATRAIRRLPGPAARVPIIAMTANALAEHRAAYLGAGMDDYLTKPVDVGALRRALLRVRQGLVATESGTA